MLIAWWARKMRSHLAPVPMFRDPRHQRSESVANYWTQMDAEGFHIFRELRLRVGDNLKALPMGYFSGSVSAITATHLRCTNSRVHDHLTGLSGGVMAVIMVCSSYFQNHQVPSSTFVGIAVGLCFGLAEKTLDRRHTGGHCTGRND